MSEPIVIGFGGNVGEPHEIGERFADIRLELGALGEITAAAMYRSAPIGPAQPDFYNTAIRIETRSWSRGLTPVQLLARLHELEDEYGRDRTAETRWGPRPIDLDILVWGARLYRGELEIPHPRLGERRFALEPLVSVVGPDFEIPGQGRAGDLLARVQDQRVERLGAW